MTPNAFLTERRREYLNGDYNLDNSKDRHLKRSLEQGAQTALKELIEVANSPEIDNASVFDSQQVHLLLDALFRDGEQRLTPLWDYDGDAADYNDEFAYQKTLHSSLNQSMMMYGQAMTTKDRPSGMWGALFQREQD